MKRTLVCSALVLTLATLLVGFAPGDGAIRTDPEISSLLTNINPNNIFNTAQTLQNFRTRQSCSDVAGPNQGVTPARDYLFLLNTARSTDCRCALIPLFMGAVRMPPPLTSLHGCPGVIPIAW